MYQPDTAVEYSIYTTAKVDGELMQVNRTGYALVVDVGTRGYTLEVIRDDLGAYAPGAIIQAFTYNVSDGPFGTA